MLNLKSTVTGDPSAERLSVKQTASGLHQKHIALKYEDEYKQRGPHGIDIKGSFTSKKVWIPSPDVSWLFMLFF